MKILPKHISKAKEKDKYAVEQFFEDEHLNDSGITLYVEAIILKREEELPLLLREHAENCPHCQHEILDFYQMMKEEKEQFFGLHPYFDRPKNLTFTQKVRQIAPPIARVAAVFLFFTLVSLIYLLSNQPKIQLVSQIQSPFINPAIQTQFQEFNLDTDSMQVIKLASGSEIYIPAQAFVNAQGQIVQGKVKVSFRELHSAQELIASGIPLSYDSLGKAIPFEIGGLVEVRGSRNGQILSIHPSKALYINLLSKNNQDNLNDYYLEERNTQVKTSYIPFVEEAYAQNSQYTWKYLGKSHLISPNFRQLRPKSETLDLKIKELEQLEKEILARQKNIEPEVKNDHLTKVISPQTQKPFKLALNVKENPIMIRYQDKIFEYAGENQDESPMAGNQWIFREKWDNLYLNLLHYRPLTLKGHTQKVNMAKFSPDGQKIVTASADGTARLWTNEAQYLATLQGHNEAVNSACFSPDGSLILTASADHTAKIWKSADLQAITLIGHQQAINEAVFSPDGKFVLTTGTDKTAKLWTVKGQLIKSLPHHHAKINAKFSPDGKQIMTLTGDTTLQIWSLEGKIVSVMKGKFNSAVFSPNGKFVLTAPANPYTGKAILWSNQGQQLRILDISDAQAFFSPTGNQILSLNGVAARLWFFSQQKYFSTQLTSSLQKQSWDEMRGHDAQITAIDYARDGKTLLTASNDQTAKVWSEDGRFLHTLRGHKGRINSAVFSPDARQMLTASDDFTAKIWVERPDTEVFELALSKKNQTLIDESGRQVFIPGKKFYSIVKFAKEEIETKVQQPQPDLNPLYQMTEKFEKLKTEIKELETQQVLAQVSRRAIRVNKFGIYLCARLYRPSQENWQETMLDLQTEAHLKPQKVYHITGEYQTAIIEYDLQRNPRVRLDLAYPPHWDNKFIGLLANDRVIRLDLPLPAPAAKNSDKNMPPLLLMSNARKINNWEEWEEVFRRD